MHEHLQADIKRNIAQIAPNLFANNVANVNISLSANIISASLEGEWTLSGAQDTTNTSAGCINDTYIFKDNKVETTFNFTKNGEEAVQQSVSAQKINITLAFDKESAVKKRDDRDKYKGNWIIVYIADATAILQENLKQGGGFFEEIFVNQGYGVIFKGEFEQEYPGYAHLDRDFINACLIHKKVEIHTSQLRFENVADRGFTGYDYYVEYMFSAVINLVNKQAYNASLQYYSVESRDFSSKIE